MRLLTVVSTFLLASTLCGCRGANKEPAGIAEPTPVGDAALNEPMRSLSGPLTIASNTTSLPDSCKVAFVALSKQPTFEMADPGQRFQAGDVVIEQLPRRRLVFGAFRPDRCLIHYEKGGYAHSYYAVLFGLSPDGRAAFLWGGAGFKAEPDLEHLRLVIASRNFRTLEKTETSW